MDLLGIVLILLGAYLVDSALKNRRPLRTAGDVLRNPSQASEILAAANGTGWLSRSGGGEVPGSATPSGFDPSSSTNYDPTLGPIGVTPGASAGDSSAGAQAVAFARSKIGTMYLWGGTGPRYDCSGLVMKAWESAGYSIPRTTYAEIADTASLVTVSKPELPGDLIFPNAGHVMMYTGNGTVVEAPRTGLPVRETTAPTSWLVVRRPKAKS